MNNMPEIDYLFNFKFNLHKSVIPIGIDDHDYDRLKIVYGVNDDWIKKVVADIETSNSFYAEKLAKQFDLSILNKSPLKVIFLGDSITSDRQSYLNILKKATAGFENLKQIDMSISAHKSGDLFTATYPGIIAEHANIAHIMIGTNDVRQIDDENRKFHTSPEEYEKNVDYVVSELVKDGTKVILSTIPPYSQEKASTSFVGCRALFLEESRQLYNQILSRVAERNGALLNQMDPYYSAYKVEEITLVDGIHLNAIGQDLLAQGVVKSIMKIKD